METQSQDTTPKTRIEAARQAVLGSLARAKETLQVAATTVPAWARDVELRAGERADALLERVGLVRIAKVQAKPAAATVDAVAAEPPVAVTPDETTAEPAAEPAVEAAEAAVEAVEEPAAEPAVEAAGPAPAGAQHDRGGRRRRR